MVELGVNNIRFDSDSALWGITPVVADVNTILAGRLECRFESISIFGDWEFEERLAALTESGQFPIIGFDYNTLFGARGPEDLGHCAEVYRIHKASNSKVEIYDPGPDEAGVQTVDLYAVYRACRKKHGGIWTLAPFV